MIDLANKLIKQIKAAVFMSSSKFRKICENHAQSGRFVILAYHRINKPSADQYIEPGMYLSPAAFKKQMEILGRYFQIVSLEKVCRERIDINRPSCVLTFDDGWIDFYTNVYPVLKEYQYPATVFLPTEYIGTKRMFWPDCFANLMIKRKFDTGFLLNYLEDEKSRKELKRKFNRKNLHELINLVKKYSMERDREVIWRIVKENDLIKEDRYDFLNWDQVYRMKESKLVNFGSHTSEHVILTSESVERVRAELHRSRETLLKKNVVSSEFIPFCYPNGFTNDAITEQVRSAGYHCAVTVRRKWNNSSSDIYRLNRIGMHQDVCFSSSMIISRLGNTPS